ncbi:hypothetical protein [Streptomyces lavendofoliae]|uniref:Uncharacterized protein n=1 Tax=Streptomyces lavendofoliae TaxID=67314 RepID=A0A918I2W3_9ACTN|nr:hypothetical protein [Streptomyces lavendofoliae]GGU58327.1 hypothetical protein GCM10010274_54120 [Streptomyces lavendofoliae]
MAQYLGPLELRGNQWVIGDPARGDGLSVVLTPEGLEHRRRDEAAPLLAVEWSDLTVLRVRAAHRRWQGTAGGGFVGAFQPGVDTGRDGCSLHGVLRRPREPWSVRYTHHERRYTGGHVIALKALFSRLTAAKALDRLGNGEWLGTAVERLSSYSSWSATKGDLLVEETIRSLGA